MVLELVKDKSTMEFFEPSLQAEHLFQAITLKNGLVMYGSLYGARRQPAFRRGCPPGSRRRYQFRVTRFTT